MFYDKLALDKRCRSALAGEEGVSRKNKKENTDTIFRHSLHARHKKIIEMLQQQTNETIPQNCEDLHKLDDKAIYQVINRFF